MDLKKIGVFLRRLREEKNITQDELANLVNVHRTTVNKWENGKALPLNDTLSLLSEYYNITINEILLGERKSKQKQDNHLIFMLLNTRRKLIKYLLFFGCSLFLCIIFFLIYYFIVTFNSIHIYRISGESEHYKTYDGLMIMSTQKSYFKLGQIADKKSNNKIENIELYIVNQNQEKLIYKGNAYNVLINNYSSQEYFNYTEINENTIMYLLICEIDNKCEKLELHLKKDSQNNKLFSAKKEEIDFDENLIIEENVPIYIQKNFTFSIDENAYVKENKNERLFYLKYSNIFGVIKNNTKKNIEERFLFDFNNSEFSYIKKDLKNNTIIKESNSKSFSEDEMYKYFYNKYLKFIK